MSFHCLPFFPFFFTLLGLNNVLNFDYHDTITLGETPITILLLSRAQIFSHFTEPKYLCSRVLHQDTITVYEYCILLSMNGAYYYENCRLLSMNTTDYCLKYCRLLSMNTTDYCL